MDPSLLARLERCRTLPTLPGVALEILSLCRSEDPDVERMARVLTNDAALTAQLLRRANSPALGLRREVRTVRNAISLLGVLSVRTLALSFSIARGLRADQRAALGTYWRRAAISGIAARALAQATRHPDREEAFLAGLLADIGMLVLAQVRRADPAPAEEPSDDFHAAACASELAEFGVDHAEVGAWLTERWALPVSLVAAIRHSHDVAKIAASGSSLAKLVAVAGAVADIWIHGDAKLATRRAIEMSRRILGLPDDVFMVVVEAVRSEIPEIAQLLEVHLATPAECDELIEDARDALAEVSMQSATRAEQARRSLTELERRSRELSLAAHRDGLTGLANRACLDEFLAVQVADAVAQGHAMSVIMIDLDRFKAVNDSYGHPGGDAVLVATAGVLQSGIRPRDLAGRFGGEEFCVVLPETNESGARIVAERMRARIAARMPEVRPGHPLCVTASLGYATWDPRESAWVPSGAELVARADRALYRAKHGGRDRVEGTTANEHLDELASPIAPAAVASIR